MSAGPSGGSGARARRGRAVLVAAALLAAVLAAFAPAALNEFINFDDPNLFNNPRVRQGFGAAGLRWAFTTTETQNWHPLTWLSHMLDFRLFGMWAGGHHLVSVLVHAANAALLFLVLRAMTGALWRSALAAAVFGLHPLRVESVAWASERKDVLALLFGLLALGAYVRHVRGRGAGSYAAAVALHACALMSKAMLVTFPGLLLLLDLWPLGRWRRVGGMPLVPGRRLLLEKLPFLALSIAASVATFLAQDTGGAVAYEVQFPLGQRVGNAFVSYGAYLVKTFWPAKLAVFYPYYWADVPRWQPALGAAAVGGCTVAAVLALGRRPAWFVGWAWYVGTLVPVIGLVQVGSQSMADRYTYLPQIGILLALVWGLGNAGAGRSVRGAVLAAALLVPAALAAATWLQVSRWRSSVTIFSHALRVTESNFVALSHLGYALVDQGKTAEGRELIARSFAVLPASRATALEGAGDFYANLGMAREAGEQYAKALAVEPSKDHLRQKLRALGDLSQAPAAPAPPDPHRGEGTVDPYERGNLLVRQGRREEAVAAYREAIRAVPDDAEAWHNLGCALAELGRREEAIAAIEEALRLKPDHPLAGRNLEAIRGVGVPRGR